jgi:hypothetical protein
MTIMSPDALVTHHPHVHMIVPGGGLSMDGGRWISCKPNFLLPVRVLSKLFRRLMLEKLLAAHEAGSLRFFGSQAHLADSKTFAALLAPLSKKRWFVYAKRPFAGPRAVLAYLSRYTHRVAISNRRLITVDERSVTFKVKNYRIEGPGRYTMMTLEVREFIRRFSSTYCPRASIASATTACSPAAIAPRSSRGPANSWVWPRLRPRRRPRSIRRWRRCSRRLAPAVAAACSSLRPSMPAASHATVQPCLSSQSGSTPHERGHNITHPHRQSRFSLVTTRPRRRSIEQLSGSASHSPIFFKSHRHRCSSKPETHQRLSLPDRHALAPCIRRQNRDQIAIARASPSATHLPRVPSL